METQTPRTLMQAIQYFSDPDVCLAFVVKLRWSNGIIACPRCGCMNPSFLKTRRIWKCRDCSKQFSVKVGTIFEDSALGLDKWLVAIWLIANAKNGVSSCELARSIGVQQKSAWFMLHRIRLAMQTGSFLKMEGTVAVDETFIGGKAKNMHADIRREKRAKGFPKSVVFGMREEGGEVRTMVVADTTKATLQTEIREHVAENAVVCTDSWKAYTGLSEDYQHQVVDHKSGEYVNSEGATTNGMENYWSILKRCYHGTYIQMSPQHLSRYLSEEDFRFNNRNKNDGERFVQVLSQIAGKRLTFDELTASHLQRILPR